MLSIKERLREHLRFLDPAGRDESQGMLELLHTKYRRRLAQYENLDRALRAKYGLTFRQFERRNIVRQQNFSWEVESDAMAWEQAHDGIKTLKRRLKELDALAQEA
jgi:hypothetical protein